MAGEKAREMYEKLFPNADTKARAFDDIAQHFFFGNFGTMGKADFEVLLFSIYLERILDQEEDNLSAYSDYTLSKQLGITQSRISTLKVRKQLQYPYSRFSWQSSFQRLCENAAYEGGKIRINLRDRNLYYELRNQIDEMGSYVETTLTPNLLVISPAQFFDLTYALMEEDERETLKKQIRERYERDQAFCVRMEEEPIGQALWRQCGDDVFEMISDILPDLIPAPIGTGLRILKTAATTICERIKRRKLTETMTEGGGQS